MELGIKTQDLDLEGSEDLKLNYLLWWPTCFSCSLVLQVLEECLLELGAGTKGCERREAREDLLEEGAARTGRRPKQVVFYSADMKLGSWNWKRGENLQVAYWIL